jgi:cytochrome c5
MSVRLLTVALLLPLATAGQAADFDAEKFIGEKCSQCHDSSVYTRPDRRVQSLDGLNNQVRRCDSMIGTKLFEDDINAVVDHLNTRYYHF